MPLQVASGDTSNISWNFAKFLVDKEGKVISRYGPGTNPSAIIPGESLDRGLFDMQFSHETTQGKDIFDTLGLICEVRETYL